MSAIANKLSTVFSSDKKTRTDTFMLPKSDIDAIIKHNNGLCPKTVKVFDASEKEITASIVIIDVNTVVMHAVKGSKLLQGTTVVLTFSVK